MMYISAADSMSSYSTPTGGFLSYDLMFVLNLHSAFPHYKYLQSYGSQSGKILPASRHWATSEDMFDCLDWGGKEKELYSQILKYGIGYFQNLMWTSKCFASLLGVENMSCDNFALFGGGFLGMAQASRPLKTSGLETIQGSLTSGAYANLPKSLI